MMFSISGCGGGSFNPVAPAASLPGTWVRDLQPGVDYSLVFVSVPAETLFVAGDRGVTWSQEVWFSDTDRDRVRLAARLNVEDAIVYLDADACPGSDPLSSFCAGPVTVTGRPTTAGLQGRYRVVRMDEGWIRVDEPAVSSRPSRWFRRVAR